MYDDELTNLDDWLRRLKIEYDVFFNGNRKKAPDDLKMRVERVVKKLSEAGDMSLQQRFRYNTLVSRYCIYRDLWRRMLLDREAGVTRKGFHRTAGPAAPSGSLEAPPAAAETRETIRLSISDPAGEQEKVRRLYEGLMRLQENQAETTIPFERFAAYIADRTRALRAKHGCGSVEFLVFREENAIRFTARAERNP